MDRPRTIRSDVPCNTKTDIVVQLQVGCTCFRRSPHRMLMIWTCGHVWSRLLHKTTQPPSQREACWSYFDEVRIFPALTVVKLDPGNERLPPLREDESKNTVLWKVVADRTVADKTPLESLGLQPSSYGHLKDWLKERIE